MSAHFTVSLELVAFMRWLIKNKKSEIATLMRACLSEGFHHELLVLKHGNVNLESQPQYINNIITSFLQYLEEELFTSYHEHTEHRKKNPALLTTLSDKTKFQLHNLLDQQSVRESLAETEAMLHNSPSQPSEQAKKQLILQNVLQKWFPTEGEEIN